jgi:phospholipase/carboxylesterase
MAMLARLVQLACVGSKRQSAFKTNMNRIALAPPPLSFTASQDAPDELAGSISFASRRLRRDERSPFATFEPIHYERGYAYPLLVWLHGAAGSERELRHVMPRVSTRNYVAIAPRGCTPDRRHSGRYDWQQTSDAIEASESLVAGSLAAATRQFNVHPRRVFLAGYGTGGTMAVRLAWNNPARFAGVVSINGPLPSSLRPLREINELRRVPCLLATTRDSQIYPQDCVCNDLRLLHSAGCTVALRQYPGADELTREMLSDMDRWLMELVCGQRSDS